MNSSGGGDSAGPELVTYDTMNREIRDSLHFAILNGDWLYEQQREYPPSSWMQQVGLRPDQKPDVVNYAPTIVGVWENYKTYLSRGRNLAEWHRNVPSFYTWTKRLRRLTTNRCSA